jgi:hypothetical protein
MFRLDRAGSANGWLVLRTYALCALAPITVAVAFAAPAGQPRALAGPLRSRRRRPPRHIRTATRLSIR